MKKLPLVFAPLFSFTIGLTAQNGQEEEPVFELNPFVVETSEQDGYLATNSNSGTRLSQNIKDLPLPVEIITGEFIEDIGALDVKEALEFTAGLQTEITSQQTGENTTNPNAFRLRGFVSEAVMRSGFRVIGATDSVNIAQIDVVRGPNALLYGIGNFGGVVNYITARPTPEFRANTGLTIGSWDFRRASVQARGPVGEKHGYSIGVFDQGGKSWIDHVETQKRGISFLWEYRPTESLTLTFEYDHIFQDNQSGENPLSPNFLTFLEDGDFIDPSHFPQSLLDFDGTDIYADPSSRRGFLRYPSEAFRYAGPDVSREIRDTTMTLNLTYQITENLSLQMGVNRVTRDRFEQDINLRYSLDLQNILAANATGARLRSLYPWMYLPQHPQYEAWSTPQFQSLRYSWDRNENNEERDQARAELAWNKDFLNIRNTVVLGMTYNGFLPNMGANYALKDLSRDSVPLTQSDPSGLQDARPRYQSIFNYEPIRLERSEDEEWVRIRGMRRPSKFWERGYYLIHQGKFWDDKISTVAGFRYDWIHTARAAFWNSNNEGYQPDLLGRIREYRHRADGPSTDFNTSLGVSYIPNDALTLFVLRASALQPIYNQTNPTGFIPEPQSGISQELGIKLELLDRKISGSISIYQIEREGVPVRTGATTYARDNPEDPNVDPDWVAQGRGDSVDFGSKQDVSRGVDAQFFLTNLVQGLQTVLSFSYNDYEWEKLTGLSFVRKEGSGEEAEFIFEQIDISDSINRNRKHNDTPEWTVRLWNKYVFGEGMLEGLSLGLGYTWTDEREATFRPARETLKIIPARSNWSASVNYGGEWRRFTWSLQLNVYNLTDETGVAGYDFITPRNYRLALKIEF